MHMEPDRLNWDRDILRAAYDVSEAAGDRALGAYIRDDPGNALEYRASAERWRHKSTTAALGRALRKVWEPPVVAALNACARAVDAFTRWLSR